MIIELDDVTALEIRVQLYVAARRWDESATTYEGMRESIADMYRKKADHAFKLMNEFRVATGQLPYTIEYLRGECDY